MPACKLHSARKYPHSRNNLANEAKPQRLIRVHRPPRQKNLHSPCAANQTRQSQRPSPSGNQSKRRPAMRKHRIATANSLPARQRQIESPAHRNPAECIARARAQAQAVVVAQLEEQRKRWTVAEETLLALRRTIDDSNQTESAKAQQVLLDETVLRRWLDLDPNQPLDL